MIVQHQKKVLNPLTDNDFQMIYIRRSHLISDAFEQFGKKNFDPSGLLKVCFVGESAEDVGGPRREFFRLIIEEMFQLNDMFQGWPSNVTMRHNIEAAAANMFFLVGKILSVVMIQGGRHLIAFPMQ